MLSWMEYLFSFGGEYAVYVGVLGILLASGLGLPLPEDIPLLVGGLLCHSGHASLWVMLPSCTAAVFAADLMLYVLGRRYGHHVQKLPFLRGYLTEKRLAAAEIAFHRHGGKTLFMGRFVPGIRSAVFFTAGVFKIPAWKMIAIDGVAVLLSVPTLILAGYFGARQFQRVTEWTGIVQVVVAVLMAGVVAFFLVRWKLRKRKQASAAAQAPAMDAGNASQPPLAASAVSPAAPLAAAALDASRVAATAAKLTKGAGPLPS